MFTLFHFGFELIKIGILSGVYGGVIYLLKFACSEISRGTRIKKITFKTIYRIVALVLFIFSFTYYGDHGLGDEANIPLGNRETMNSSDGYAFFTLPVKPYNQIKVDSFLIKNNHLCMASDSLVFDYQLKTGAVANFENFKLYDAYALDHHLPVVKDFKKFWPQYARYWNGWRFWFLP